MTITERERKIQDSVCPPCRNDRYNHPGIEDAGAPVTSEKCRLVVYVKYDRITRRYICPYINHNGGLVTT